MTETLEGLEEEEEEGLCLDKPYEEPETLQNRRFECVDGNSNKFYELAMIQHFGPERYTVEIAYGPMKLGGRVTTKVHEFKREWQAVEKYNALTTLRLKHGYKEVHRVPVN